ncbi:hypothetical protein AGMMS49546_25490 [Spirochaetia bacterium]|nr:hypothetical protein AGMMS49546_25490 [Spirochaetia bacterium]
MRYILILVLISSGIVLSCKSVSPQSTGIEPPLTEKSALAENSDSPLQPQDASLSEETALPAELAFMDEEPSIAEVPEGPADVDGLEGLLEPLADLAEADQAALSPAEGTLSGLLPEPAVEIPEPEPPVEPVQAATGAAQESQSPTPAPPPAVPAAPPVPVVEPRQEPPSPPRFIRPAEEETPPPIVREPVPLPVRPLPELPAAAPPVVRDDEGIVFSRVVRATVGQLVEIPFRGTNWVYLGELGARRGISYDSRRLDQEGQSFVFRAEAAGTYVLKFDRQDFVRDYILNDHVQVIIGEAPEVSVTGYFNPALDRGRVVAEPRWPTAAEEAEAFRRGGNSPAAGAAASASSVPNSATTQPSSVPAAGPGQGAAGSPQSSVPPSAAEASPSSVPVTPAPEGQAVAPSPVPDTPDQYLQRAREEFDAGRVAAAIGILDQFREWYPSGSDEAYWLYGQFYEANSPARDIRLSLDYYRRLVREYPQSNRYNAAQRRIAYLERYYINIQ